jgi:1-acyl-sn-glycerol-3-phosphate acyltransferase
VIILNAFVRTVVRGVYHIWYNFTIEGEENIPQDRPLIIASNHRSFADPVVITIPFRRPLTYMARDTLFKNKLFAAFIRFLGAFPVKRDSASTELFRTTEEILASGKNLVIFPEGTRQYKNKVGSGKSGVAMIAAKSGADVIPCGICFEGEKLHFRSKLTVRFGKVISAEELAIEGTSSKELRRVKEIIMNGIKLLVEGEPQPVAVKMPDGEREPETVTEKSEHED